MPSPARKLRLSVRALAIGVSLFALTDTSATAGSAGSRVETTHITPDRPSNDAQNRDVRIHNQTGWPIIRLYASSGGSWGPDLLNAVVLLPGRSVVLTLDDGSGACRYSLRAEFENGQSRQRDGIEACTLSDDYFTR